MTEKKPDQVLRGQMYYANLNPIIGSEQGGVRPVLVIQNNIGNQFSPTIIVAPITTEIKKIYQPTHIRIPPHFGIARRSMAMLEQIRTIDKSRLKDYIGCLDDDVMDCINKALGISVGLTRSMTAQSQNCRGREGEQENIPEEMTLTLCPVCLNQFIHSPEHIVRRVDRTQTRETCMYCNVRDGHNYRIIRRKKRMGDDRY